MRLAALVLLTGCDALFGLKTTSAPPDAVPCGSPDEDGDCIADDADNCPGTANAQQAHASESATPSGAGDVCDPDPTQSGHAVTFFDGFADPAASDVAWANQFGGGWTIVEGMAQNMATGNFGLLRHVAIDDANDLTVEARFVFHSAMLGVSDTRLGVFADLSDADASGQTCWYDPTSNRVLAQESNGNIHSVTVAPLIDGDVMLLVMRRVRDAMRLDCAVTINGARVVLETVTTTAAWSTMQHVAIQAHSIAADLSYVTLYTR